MTCRDYGDEPVKESAGEPAVSLFGLWNALESIIDLKTSQQFLNEIEALHARILSMETVLEFIENMEGQEGMTDALFAKKTLALIHALGAS